MSKKIVFAVITLLVVLSLAACSSNQATQASQGNDNGGGANPSGGNPPAQGTPGASNGSSGQMLALGILELEGTSNAVTAAQAATLIPLWKQIQTLSADTSATNDQYQAIYTQIQAALTSDQITAIQGMSFNQSDLQSLYAKLGITETPGANGDFPGGFQGTPGFGGTFPANGTPGAQGTFPANGGGGFQGTPSADRTPRFSGTPGAQGTPGQFRQGGFQVSSSLISAVLQVLQSKSSS